MDYNIYDFKHPFLLRCNILGHLNNIDYIDNIYLNYLNNTNYLNNISLKEQVSLNYTNIIKGAIYPNQDFLDKLVDKEDKQIKDKYL